MSEEENKPEQYVIMTQEVLCRSDISILAKLVYARISGFKEFYETAETTGAFFGKSADRVRKAKQELEKAGLIKCVKDNGRGKCYVAILRLVENDQSDWAKTTNQTRQLCPPYNKEDNKEDNSNNKLLLGDKSQNEVVVKEEYGNEKINEMFRLWEERIGYPLKNTANNRRAVYNMLRAKDKGEKWLNTMLLVLAKANKDKFSGVRISNFYELQTKTDSLMAYAKRLYDTRQETQIVDISKI